VTALGLRSSHYQTDSNQNCAILVCFFNGIVLFLEVFHSVSDALHIT
jgi:hypothetical protein